MNGVVAETLRIGGISMLTIFGVMLVLYAAMKIIKK